MRPLTEPAEAATSASGASRAPAVRASDHGEALPTWRRLAHGAALASPFVLGVIVLGLGLYPIAVGDVLRSLASLLVPDVAADVPEIARRLVLDVRLPRVLAALLIGG
ncbi:MAG: hypothetical protein ABR510_11935, partial [Trueperaceae bacterium]